jgi:two-component system, NarL family, nitrate/nitrite response regulator NarL
MNRANREVSSMATRAIIIEDEEAVARLIGQVLESYAIEVCGVAASGEEGLALALKEKPDVALVDLCLPKMSGEDVIRAIKKDLAKTSCIALTAVDIPARVLNALRAGASGYVLKPFRAAELARAVEEVLSGVAAPISPRAARVLLSEVRGDPPEQHVGPPLSKRELEVLELLVRGHTYADVGVGLGIAEGTVQTYVKRIYEKLEVSTKAEAAFLAVSRGLVRI